VSTIIITVDSNEPDRLFASTVRAMPASNSTDCSNTGVQPTANARSWDGPSVS